MCHNENPEKPEKKGMFDIRGDVWAIFVVNLWKRCAYKLCSIILLQFELLTFRFAYMRTLKLFISMIWGFSVVSLSPQTIYFYLWRHQDTPSNQENKAFSKNILLDILELAILNIWKTCVPLSLLFFFKFRSPKI